MALNSIFYSIWPHRDVITKKEDLRRSMQMYGEHTMYRIQPL